MGGYRVAKKQAAIELKSDARIVAIQALHATGCSVRRIVELIGSIDKSQVSRDTQVISWDSCRIPPLSPKLTR